MEEKLHFKVYVFWRENEKPEVRRLFLEKIFLNRFFHLNVMLQDMYPDLKTKTYSVAWKDEDGDEIVLSSDIDMITALEIWREEVIKLFVYCKPGEDKYDIIMKNGTPNSNKPADTRIHHGVRCDVCAGAVVGFRYKCGVCDDYDLCSRCEAAGHHPEHNMVRISTPRPVRIESALPLRTAKNVVGLPIHQMIAPHMVGPLRGTASRSTSLEFRVGLPALDLQLAFNNNENRSIQ